MPKQMEMETSRFQPFEANEIVSDNVFVSLETKSVQGSERLPAYQILTTNKSPLSHVSCPWRRFHRVASSAKVLVLTRNNYKV